MKSVLIVNENKLQRKAVGHLFLKLHCTVFEASNGDEAKHVITANNIDLALIDLQKSSLDGFTLHRWISNKNIHRDIPIIISSSEEQTSFAF